MAIKFAGIRGKEIHIIGTNRQTLDQKETTHLTRDPKYDRIALDYPRTSAMHIVIAVTRPKMSASRG